VQAPLVGEGAHGWIAGQWALEYAVQFGRLLPGLVRQGLPVMLGGTSNHFRGLM
jgi:glycosyltransferase XagB